MREDIKSAIHKSWQEKQFAWPSASKRGWGWNGAQVERLARLVREREATTYKKKIQGEGGG